MSRIRWNGPYLGRHEGDIEIVETDTDFMRALLENARYEILPDEEPEAPVVEQSVVEVPKPKAPRAKKHAEPEVDAVADVTLPEVEPEA